MNVFRLLWAATAAFGTYFCMYAFRKPFTVSEYADSFWWGLSFKSILVSSQVLGYWLSKFIGIKVIAEMPPQRRAVGIIALILIAELALVLFAVVPRPWNAACMFFNGLPLGMVFGLVMGYLEGRRMTEALAAGLCASFILADGMTKSAGSWLCNQGISEEWMPSLAGAMFLLPLLIFVGMLTRIPPPDEQDIAHRSERRIMNRQARSDFFRRYAIGLVPILLMYLIVTLMRSVRADFAPEIWKGLGMEAVPSTFTYSELYVMLGVLLCTGSQVFLKSNRIAFFTSLGTCLAGFAMISVALIWFRESSDQAFLFMVLLGLGLYLPYVSVHTTVFERLIAMTREHGNIGFLMYLADSLGYMSYVLLMMAPLLFDPKSMNMSVLLIAGCWISIGISCVCLLISALYFRRIPCP